MKFRGGETERIVIAGLGAGSVTYIVGQLRAMLNIPTTYPDSWIKLIIGAVLWKFGKKIHRYATYYGAGALIAGIGDFVNEFLIPHSPTKVSQMLASVSATPMVATAPGSCVSVPCNSGGTSLMAEAIRVANHANQNYVFGSRR